MLKLPNQTSIERDSASSPRFSSLDFLAVSSWMCLAVICLLVPTTVSFASSVFGGAVLVIQHFYVVVYRGGKNENRLQVALAIPIFLILSELVHEGVEVLTPRTYDDWLMRWDFGVERAVRSWSSGVPWVWYPTTWCYYCLPLAVLLFLVFTRGVFYRRLLWGLLLAGLLAVPCYLLFPAVGPVHVGDPHAPRNCMPSLHLTWALLLWVNSRGWIRWAALAFALIIALATLATGEHYVLDLVMALPFTWGVAVLSRRIADRKER